MLAALAHRDPFGLAARRDLIREAAPLLLAVRAAEAVAALAIFHKVYSEAAAQPAWVYASLLAYVAANSLLALRYRRRGAQALWATLDLATNLALPLPVLHACGGAAGPLLWMYPIKISGYVGVFGPEMGSASAIATLVLVGSAGALEQAGWWPVGRGGIDPVLEARVETGARAAFLGFLVVGGALWLRRLRRQEEALRYEKEKAQAAAEREHNAAAIAGTLLVVSDAVSRLTQIRAVLGTVVEVVPKVLDVDYCGVFEWDDGTSAYRGSAITGLDPRASEAFRKVHLPAPEAGDFEWVRRLGRCAVVPPIPRTPLGPEEVPALLIAPLLSGGRFFGVLLFARKAARPGFTQRDMTVADGVAAQVAVALERAALVEDARRLVRALESSSDAVVITDRGGRIAYANAAFLNMFGYERHEIVGRAALSAVRDLAPEWAGEATRIAQQGNWRGETVGHRRDGTTLPLLLDASLIREPDGSVRGAVAILKDITERKKAEERMQRAEKLAAAGEMAAGVAHEINNAVAGIFNQAERARAETDAYALQRAISRIETQAHRIAAVARGLLDFARPRQPARRAVDLGSLLEETVELGRYELADAGVEVEVALPPDLPKLWADPGQIRQVLVNLIANARQALAQKGGGRIWIRARHEGQEVVIEVEDNGPGIPPDHALRIFDPFFTTKPTGTGLGLSVSYQIARAHGGDLSLRNATGGAHFALRLPAAAPATVRRALVVDDDPLVGSSLVDMLSRAGIDADHVASGQEALSRLASEPAYDAVFLDVRLGDLTGVQVYERLAAADPEKAKRVVFVTGGLRREGCSRRLGLPSQLALAKPYTEDQLRAVLQALEQRLAA